MRTLAALVVAFGLIVAVAGTALADCGASHGDGPKPTSSPQPQA